MDLFLIEFPNIRNHFVWILEKKGRTLIRTYLQTMERQKISIPSSSLTNKTTSFFKPKITLMKRIFQFILFFFLFLFLSCNKDDNDLATVEGTVIEFGTNEPIEGATVILQLGSGATSLGGGANVSRRDTFITQADGNYLFTYKSEDFTYSNLVADHKDYFFNNPPDGIVCCNYQYDIVMDPNAWIKLHVKNTMPVNMNDKIKYTGEFERGISLPLDEHFGADFNQYFVEPVRGNREILITWWVTKSNQETKFEQKVICPARDTTLFEVFY